jgi:hypothetical protein
MQKKSATAGMAARISFSSRRRFFRNEDRTVPGARFGIDVEPFAAAQAMQKN